MDAGAQERGSRALDEQASAAILRAAGLPFPEMRAARSCAEALRAAAQVGYPVALKVCSPAVPHKSDAGGVFLGLAGPRSLRAAARELARRFARVPHLLLVQAMAPRGVELILGARRDPVFGPCVLVGMGGIFTEVMGDAAVEIAPVGPHLAREMIWRLKGAPLLRGARGRPPVDVGAAARAVAALSRLIRRRGDIAEIDVNPLVVHPGGAVAVDALVIEGDRGARPAPRAGRRPPPRTLAPFFTPRSIAVVGASRNPRKGGSIVMRNIVAAGFAGRLVPVNPSGERILGRASARSVSEIDGAVDLAMLVIPKERVAATAAECARKRIPAVILATGGYGDLGPEGRAEEALLARAARRAGMRLMGPNSIGTMNPSAGVATSIVGVGPVAPGGVSLFGQTGVFASGWARWIADASPFGLAKVACIGNKADVDEADLLAFAAADRRTRTIGMYLEGVADGRRFVRAAAAAARRKPVVVLKSGRSEAGARAAASHTGSLACSDAVFDAVCRRAGMVRARGTEGFFDALAAIDGQPPPAGRRLGVLSITGMGCVLATDLAAELGVALPPLRPATEERLRRFFPAWAPLRNPVDIWSAVEKNGCGEAMGLTARALHAQDDVDALVVVFVLMPESVFDIGAFFGWARRARPRKPLLVAHLGGTEREARHLRAGFAPLGVPCYPSPERALAAFASMAECARLRRKLTDDS